MSVCSESHQPHLSQIPLPQLHYLSDVNIVNLTTTILLGKISANIIKIERYFDASLTQLELQPRNMAKETSSTSITSTGGKWTDAEKVGLSNLAEESIRI